MTIDHRLFKMTWDTVTEYHKPHEMREKFAKTNLFDSDGAPWVRQLAGRHGPVVSAYHSLEDVLVVIQPGEEWTCDNCTVTLDDTVHRLNPTTIELVDDPGKYVKDLKTTVDVTVEDLCVFCHEPVTHADWLAGGGSAHYEHCKGQGEKS